MYLLPHNLNTTSKNLTDNLIKGSCTDEQTTNFKQTFFYYI